MLHLEKLDFCLSSKLVRSHGLNTADRIWLILEVQLGLFTSI